LPTKTDWIPKNGKGVKLSDSEKIVLQGHHNIQEKSSISFSFSFSFSFFKVNNYDHTSMIHF